MQYILIAVGVYIAIHIVICGVIYCVKGLNPTVAPWKGLLPRVSDKLNRE